MKFECLDKEDKVIGNIVGKDAAETLYRARKMNTNVVRVELIPGQEPEKEPKVKEEKPKVKPASEVMAEAAERKAQGI